MSNFVADNYGLVLLKPRRVGLTHALMSQQEYEKFLLGTFNDQSFVTTKVEFPVLYKNGSNYRLDGKSRVYDHGSYFRYYNHLSELTLHERVYLKERRVQSEDTTSMVRRTGRSTQIIDAAILELVRDGETILMDHHPLGDRFIWREFMHRMRKEHPEIEFVREEGTDEGPKLFLIVNG